MCVTLKVFRVSNISNDPTIMIDQQCNKILLAPKIEYLKVKFGSRK